MTPDNIVALVRAVGRAVAEKTASRLLVSADHAAFLADVDRNVAAAIDAVLTAPGLAEAARERQLSERAERVIGDRPSRILDNAGNVSWLVYDGGNQRTVSSIDGLEQVIESRERIAARGVR